ncbi:MAG: rane protein [Betaproteobacteria bacterium]|nr:rane protein [Betaproteobacteria bacterium]
MSERPPASRSKLRNRARKAAVAALAVVAVSAAGLWILSRESTLLWAADQLMDRLDGRLELVGVQGSLLGTINVGEIRLEDKFGKLAISEAHMKWRPARLFLGQVAVGEMAANTVALELAPSPDEIRKPPESLRSPISFAVTDFHIARFTVTNDAGTHEISNLQAAFAGSRRHLQAEVKSLATQWGNVRGDIELGADAPFNLDGNIALTSLVADDYSVTTKLGGSLMNVVAAIDAKARDASANAKLAVAPYDVQPLTQLQFSAKGFDPRAWVKTAPTAALSGEGSIVADAGRKLGGVVTLVNATPGTIDDQRLPFARASAALQGTPDALAIADVRLDLGDAGHFAGTGAWREGMLDVKLATGNLNLRGMQKRLHKTQLAGQLELGGNGAAQRVKLALRQQPYQFRFSGALADGIATISEAYASAGNAQLSTHGKIALNAEKNFTVGGKLSNFDPARFGAYPSALLNSKFDLKGQLAPVIQVAADVSVTGSRLFGLPATVKGTFRTKNSEHPDVDMDLALNIGQTHATAKGTVHDPAQMEAMDLQLTLAGASLDELYKIVGVPLPPTPAYRINGRLVHTGALWELRQFAGAVGDSDLSGNFLVDRGRAPQMMKADLTSKRLDLADLAGFIGAEKTATGKVATPNTARVLPDTPYNLEKLKAADADIRFQGKQVLTEKLPIDDMSAHLIVKNGVLTLAPLNFGVAGGRLVSDITLDGSGSLIASRADIRVQSLQLARLVPQLKIAKASVGEMDGRVRLAARGNSIAAMLGTANGDTSLVVGEGEVSDLLLRLSNLDVANTLLVLLRGDRNIPIRCMVADLAWENGVMHPRQFIFDTQHTTLVGEGKANFADETLDMRLVAKPKGKSLVSLRGPINVRGTFANPSVMPDLKRLSVRGAAAVALSVVATPLAAIVPFVQLGNGQDVQCGPLVETAKRQIQQPMVAVAKR